MRAGYGAAEVLRGVDLVLEPGTITCVVGPNGAGKSTVLRTVSGLLRPRQGAILLDGTDIAGMSPGAVLRRGVVHVPQERGLFAGMTVWENLLMGAHIVRDTAEVRRRAAGVAERFPIVAERRRDRAGSLSGGQQKIVEIARALMLEPRLILMDEPSMGLDPKARHLVFETITGLNRDHGPHDPAGRAERPRRARHRPSRRGHGRGRGGHRRLGLGASRRPPHGPALSRRPRAGNTLRLRLTDGSTIDALRECAYIS